MFLPIIFLHFLPSWAWNNNNTQIQRYPILCYLLDPHDGVIKLRVYGLQVFECGFLVQHSLVERQREAGVDELSMVQSLKGGIFALEPTIRKEIHKNTVSVH